MFLQPNSKVIPTESRDYVEWHLGRHWYALWYIEVNDPVLLHDLTQLRQHFSDVLYQPNQRQFHITVFVAGFWVGKAVHADDFTPLDLTQQLTALKHLKQQAFELQVEGIESFEAALCLKVKDCTGVLNTIRTALLCTSQEVAALEYFPHITLGLYREALSSDYVLARMAEIDSLSYSLKVEQLTFGFYQANTLQGQLFPHLHLHLGDALCN